MLVNIEMFRLFLLKFFSIISNRSFSSDVTAAILVCQNNEMAAILVYGTGISSFLFKYFVLFHHPTGATDHVSENDLYDIDTLLLVTPCAHKLKAGIAYCRHHCAIQSLCFCKVEQ